MAAGRKGPIDKRGNQLQLLITGSARLDYYRRGGDSFQGREVELKYFRDIDRREVDFVLTEDNKPFLFAEYKSSGKKLSRSLRYLSAIFPDVQAVQVCLEDDLDLITKEGIRICSAHIFLNDFV